MSEPIEDAYFNWLYAKVTERPGQTPSTRFHSLLYFLHSTEFVWTIEGDDNRAEEGEYLRQLFINEIWRQEAKAWMDLGCSVLEMLIAFCDRASFQTEMDSQSWFWLLLKNLDLSHITESSYSREAHKIGPILETFIFRTYNELGHGGLFPLTYSERDQRFVEIWYQFSEYVELNNIA